jgi:hypothetical protein
MRIILVVLIALFAAAPGQARADNPYAVAGISNPAPRHAIPCPVEAGLAADGHAALTAMVKHPLTVDLSPGRPVTTAAPLP